MEPSHSTGQPWTEGLDVAHRSSLVERVRRTHDRIESAMNRLLEDSDDIRLRGRHFATIRVDVHAQLAAEREVLWPVLERFSAIRDLLPSAERTHEDIERTLADLDTLDIESATWIFVFSDLRAMFDRHTRWLESVVIAQLQPLADGAVLQRLGDRLAEEERRHCAALGMPTPRD